MGSEEKLGRRAAVGFKSDTGFGSFAALNE